MSSEGSVTQWLGDLKAGDQEAARKLWDRYFDRLVRMARDKLRGTRTVEDEEDAALSALNCVFLDAANGKLEALGDRDELWRLLVIVTARKASNQTRDGLRQKRGGGRVHREADLGSVGADRGEDAVALAAMLGDAPTPEFATMVAEEFRQRLEMLGCEDLQNVALWRMEGYSVEEIAARLGCGSRTVKRKLDRIRQSWAGLNPS